MERETLTQTDARKEISRWRQGGERERERHDEEREIKRNRETYTIYTYIFIYIIYLYTSLVVGSGSDFPCSGHLHLQLRGETDQG